MNTSSYGSSPVSKGTQEQKPADQSPAPAAAERPKEIGGRDGPEPTRYGDWEKAGRCIDF
ncbi:MAG TPA: DUF1674 domain-containing protein [Steroidobacteraceae bacterium]|nr:DUF1674 domain-containing protein [Steroidobacteraceae bacterium]